MNKPDGRLISNISDLIAKFLDDIVQKKNEASLRLVAKSEIAAKKADIISDRLPRAVIDD